MKSPNVQYLVKVLSGVNKGAKVRLPLNTPVTIGRSNHCDIILNGVAVADQHVKLQLQGSVVRLSPVAQPVYLDGKDIGLREAALEPYQVIEVGGVSFTIGMQGRPWPRYNPSTKLMTATQASFPEYKINENRPIAKNPWIWAAAAILLLVNVHYFTRSIGGVPGLLGFEKSVDKRINSLMLDENIAGFKISKIRNKVSGISGYVNTREDKRRIQKDLHSISDTVVTHIFVDSELEVLAGKIAQSLKENRVRFDTLEHGRLKATGIVHSRQSWQRVKENIRDDIDGIKSVNDSEVIILSEQLSLLRKKVRLEGFKKRLDLTLLNDVVVVKGELTKPEIVKWEMLKREFSKNTYVFKYRESLRKPSQKIKLAIRSVSVGEVPYVVSKDGEKYFTGSHIGEGYYINSINDDHIVLKSDDIEFPVYFGQKE